MKIIVFSQYYYPEQFRINDICEGLVSLGHDVTVVAGIPNYPQGEIFSGYEESYVKPEIHNGVRIIRCNNRPRHKSLLDLARNYISYVKEANKVIQKLDEEFDLIYVYQLSPITIALPAIKFKRKKRIPLFLYCCDIWPESVREIRNDKVLSLWNPIYMVSKVASRYVYSKAEKIGVKCNQFTDYLEDVCKVKKGKSCLLYEHAEASYLSISETPEENACYDFMFLGNIGHAQNCDHIVKAIKLLNTERTFKVHFVGDGSALEELKKFVAENELEQYVVFHGKRPVSEINEFYEFADCCMLTLSAKTAIGLTPPSKLTGYMAASRPIIAAAEGASKDIISAADCGICVETDNVEKLAQAMQYALDHSIEFIQKGINGRKYFKEHFTLEKHLGELEPQLIQMIGGKNVNI